MRKIILLISFAIIASTFLFKDVSSAWAVNPPSDEIRHKAEAGRKKDDKHKAKDQRASGCKYGRNEETGKCYEPREGQFYRDPATGEVKVKEVKCVNLPWKPCK